MSPCWKITALAPRTVIEAALLAHEDVFDWDPDVVIAGGELADDRPEDWRLEAWLPRKPSKADKAAIAGLFAGPAPKFSVELLPELDWVVESQQGMPPVFAGRFIVRTLEYPPIAAPGCTEFVIPASRAFGTGQHATTAGCLGMLSHMKRQGIVVRRLADIGAGSGLLAFAALDLWPGALATASDIDPVCLDVVAHNMALNGIRAGARQGQLTVTVADGMANPLLEARGPYDLVIANILAGPLIALAADFSRAMVPGGHLLLAGLLAEQERAVRAAYRRCGLRLAARLVRGDWSVLWLRKRPGIDIQSREHPK